MNKRTIYFHNTGPLIRYDAETLHIEDLNPQQSMRWRMSRWEMFKIGVRSIVAALVTPSRKEQ